MNNKLLIKLFIASEALFFLSLMVAYVYFWQAAHFRKEALDHLSITTTGTFTVLLVLSSLTFWLSERMHHRGLIRASSFFLLVTILLGCIFLVGQAHEYYKLINEDITIGKDEFGTSFFTLTGFHGLHVLLGLITLGILCYLLIKGHLRDKGNSTLAAVGIYWHFVDVVWLAVFTLIYVLPHFL